jgi:hypothetical protein
MNLTDFRWRLGGKLIRLGARIQPFASLPSDTQVPTAELLARIEHLVSSDATQREAKRVMENIDQLREDLKTARENP